MAGQASELSDLDPGEMVARSAIFPKYLDNGVFSKLALLSPDPLDPSDKKRVGIMAISVASMALLSGESEVHLYGCRTAAMQNRRVFANNGIEAGLDQRKFYRGYYDMNVGAIRSISSFLYTMEVKSVPELYEEAHCEIRLIPQEGATKRELKNARSDILVDMGKLFASVFRHSCPSDVRFASYIADMNIPDAQAT